VCTFAQNRARVSTRKGLSVVIITFNESRNIRRCITSVLGIADEVLVLDSFSTDDTCDVARELGARVEQHAFDGHIQQKNRAWSMATNEWVLSIDADEAPDDALAAAIAEAVTLDDHAKDGYSMNRLTNYCGHWVRYSGWYPDTKMRLFRKGKGAWTGVNPHDRFELHDMKRAGHLAGDLLHYSYYTREDHLKQIEYFSDIAARELHARNKRVGWPLIIAKVVAQYLKNLVFKAGFLDGATGFTIARLSAYATWRKYTKLRALYEA
jgi:glycosyltransferase involved in cell wall biosynthesis